MSKISKTQAEAAYRILDKKLRELRKEKLEEIKKNFKTLYPEQYRIMEEYTNLCDQANLIRKNFEGNIKYIRFWRDTKLEKIINSVASEVVQDIYPCPDYDEFIDNLLIKGEADITEYIDKFFNKLVKNA